ncbi:MAG: FecR family protein [Bacteroidales bacterium]|nr:FecR family protein [Bacteroidales bacterium]
MNDIKDLCFKYLGGTSEVEEERVVLTFIKESEGNRLLFEEWKREWKQQTPEYSQVFSFGKVKNEIRRREKARNRKLMLCSAAAAAAMLLIGGLAVLSINREVEVPENCIVRTGYNEKTQVTLPDNSVVWLNAGSSLSYCEDFIADTREVSLVGEAYFDVVKMPDSPFIVHISGSDITVKGTRFNVTAYSNEAEVSTSLIEGSIVFASEKVSVEMIPGEQLVYNVYTEDITKTKTDTRPSISWVNGKLDYASISLQKLLERLSSLYGVEFRYTPIKYKNREFRIKLNDSEPIDDILNAISVILPIDYVIEGNVITVTES